MADLAKTERTKLGRAAKRGSYDRQTVYSILDEAMVCHVGFVADGGPVVIPLNHWRHGDSLYFHGATAGRLMEAMGSGAEVCVTVTLTDGLVMARSAFHHSMNYRSVMVFGRPCPVEDDDAKVEALRHLIEHISPGRWDRVRAPSAKELKATAIMALPLNEASAKIRSGPPMDDKEDASLPVWAGVIPLELKRGAPVSGGLTRGQE